MTPQFYSLLTIKEPAASSECETALIFLNTCQIAAHVERVYKYEHFQKPLVYIRRKLGVAYEAVVLLVTSNSTLIGFMH